MLGYQQQKMLINIRSAKKLVANTNGGPHVSNMEDKLPGFFTVCFNPESMINILLFADVKRQFRVTIDMEIDSCFLIHTGKGKPVQFNEVSSRLYLFDRTSYVTTERTSRYSFLTLAERSENQFSKSEVDRARTGMKLHKSLGYPNYQEFFRLIQKRYINNCPVTVDDAKLAIHIFGPSGAMIKGKTTNKKSSCIKV